MCTRWYFIVCYDLLAFSHTPVLQLLCIYYFFTHQIDRDEYNQITMEMWIEVYLEITILNSYIHNCVTIHWKMPEHKKFNSDDSMMKLR